MHKFRNLFTGQPVPDMGALLRGADRIGLEELPPILTDCAKPKTATEVLQANLERTVLTNNARERVLRQEIADREAELADVLRAASAASTALVELTEEDSPQEGLGYGTAVSAHFAKVEAAYFAAPTDEDLEAALGRAIELDRDHG